ncbi:MAG TPA: nitronate monooxygenase [Patescibacteria group bacterium]|nr:nitronate monooxygenase [Patescibacteria group bacterium]
MAQNTSVTETLKDATTLPLIVAPLFLNSVPELVLASVREGFVGSIPAFGQYTTEGFDQWLTEIDAGIEKLKSENPGAKIGPYAANLIFKDTNARIEADLDAVIRHRVPIVMASAEASREQIEKIHAYGGIVLHDVASLAEAKRALDAGADGLIAITAGGGGQGSTMNPFVFINELRRIFDGPIALAGGLATGHDIAAAESIGADFAIMGTRFLATEEARADQAYKQMIVDSMASDIIYTSAFTAQPANFLKDSITKEGFDAEKVRKEGTAAPRITPPPGEKSKAWKLVWAAGQTVSQINDIPSVAELGARLKKEYKAAKEEIAIRLGLLPKPANSGSLPAKAKPPKFG